LDFAVDKSGFFWYENGTMRVASVERFPGAFLLPAGGDMKSKHQIFVREYLIDLNATQAATRAGYKHSYARRACVVLLRKPAIKAAIAEGMAARAKRLEIDADRVMREWAKIGFANIGNLAVWGKDGVELREHTEISENDAAAIEQLWLTGKNKGRIKLHDKGAALDALGRHLGLNRPRSQPAAGAYSNAQVQRARSAFKQQIEKLLKERGDDPAGKA
jgi:phage terminase small subunit